MGETVRRKKKGRPSKADLARRNATSGGTHEDAALEPEGDVRRSLRRRNVKYIFDFDDYIDDDDEFEDERRREKKLKLLLSLHSSSKDGDAAESTPGGTRRVSHSPTVSGSSSDHGHGKQGKNRKVVRDNEIDGSDGEENGNEIEDDEDEVGGNREEHIGEDSAPGTQMDPPCGHPLPEKKTLELILEKLQKKDIYGVYAEPVDPEELPDYHDVIEHPMDFATVRKKLTNGTYLTLEQFESDVFQICINAMQYNAPDTIYHKQAQSIQELAKKKFEKLRIDIERSDKEIKSEQKIRFHSLVKKQIRKPMSRMVQEPVGSDFSSGATLATTGDFQNGSNAIQAGGLEKPSSIDVFVEGNSSLIDNNVDKIEELQQGKSLLSRFGKKPYLHDENRRATYNISSQPATCEETLFTMFEGESKHLVTVGLYADHAYARSLAHFAATLGPVAWSVASKRIEQALPAGFKFGRGWVGEYEPLPTPVLMPEKCMLKDPISLTKFEHVVDARNDNETCRRDISAEHPENGPSLEGVPPLSSSTSMKRARAPGICVPFAAKLQTSEEVSLERRSPFLCSGFRASKAPAVVGANIQQQSSLSKNFVESEKRVLKQVELNHPPSVNQRSVTSVSDGHISNGSELSASGSREMVFGNRNSLPSAVVASKQSNTNGIISEELPNVKALSNSSSNNGMVNSSSIGLTNQMVGAPIHFPHELDQPVGDPVQLMKMLAEKAQNQQKSSNAFPVDGLPVSQSVLCPRDDPTNAAAAAARAWMSIGAVGSKPAMENTNANKNQISVDSLYNPARGFQPQISRFRGEFPTGIHLQHEKNSYQMNAFASQYDRMGNLAQIQNQHLVFPQLSPADLSRFQVQSPRRGPQMQPQQQQESRPPDLNISFQSSGSPARQSSGILVDSQQPDLALQL